MWSGALRKLKSGSVYHRPLKILCDQKDENWNSISVLLLQWKKTRKVDKLRVTGSEEEPAPLVGVWPGQPLWKGHQQYWGQVQTHQHCAPRHPTHGDFHWICMGHSWGCSLWHRLWRRTWGWLPSVHAGEMGKWNVADIPRKSQAQWQPRIARPTHHPGRGSKTWFWVKTGNSRICLTSCRLCKLKIYALKIKHVFARMHSS